MVLAAMAEALVAEAGKTKLPLFFFLNIKQLQLFLIWSPQLI
jgi:hypothetical protein